MCDLQRSAKARTLEPRVVPLVRPRTVSGLSKSTPASAVAKAVRIALAADLAVGDDVDAGGSKSPIASRVAWS
jgi:hypothetical protein